MHIYISNILNQVDYYFFDKKIYMPCKQGTVHSVEAYCRGDLKMDFIQWHLFISVPLNLCPERPVPKPDKTGREETTSAYIVSGQRGATYHCFHITATHAHKIWPKTIFFCVCVCVCVVFLQL